MDAPDLEVLTVAEAASLLRIGRNLAYEMIAEGRLPHVRIGHRIIALGEALGYPALTVGLRQVGDRMSNVGVVQGSGAWANACRFWSDDLLKELLDAAEDMAALKEHGLGKTVATEAIKALDGDGLTRERQKDHPGQPYILYRGNDQSTLSAGDEV